MGSSDSKDKDLNKSQANSNPKPENNKIASNLLSKKLPTTEIPYNRPMIPINTKEGLIPSSKPNYSIHSKPEINEIASILASKNFSTDKYPNHRPAIPINSKETLISSSKPPDSVKPKPEDYQTASNLPLKNPLIAENHPQANPINTKESPNPKPISRYLVQSKPEVNQTASISASKNLPTAENPNHRPAIPNNAKENLITSSKPPDSVNPKPEINQTASISASKNLPTAENPNHHRAIPIFTKEALILNSKPPDLNFFTLNPNQTTQKLNIEASKTQNSTKTLNQVNVQNTNPPALPIIQVIGPDLSSSECILKLPVNRNLPNISATKAPVLIPPTCVKIYYSDDHNLLNSDSNQNLDPSPQQLIQSPKSSAPQVQPNVIFTRPIGVLPVNRNIINFNHLEPTKAVQSAVKKISPLVESSPYQVKKIYGSREEFLKIFEYLIKIEELEELKPVYEKEKGFHFINSEDISQLIERFHLLNDHKSLRIIRGVKETVEKLGSRQRIFALFADSNCFIGGENVDKIVVKCNFGNVYDVKISIFHEFCLFEFFEEVPGNVESFDVIIQTKASFDRIKEGLKNYSSYPVNEDINGIFLGRSSSFKLHFEVNIPDHSADGLILLNNSQINALKNALNHKVSIIQGPPGTGKTQTISALVYNLDYLCRYKNDENYRYAIENFDDYCNENISNYFTENSKILICAASNSPVFDLRRKLVNLGINVVQVLARAREEEFKDDPGTLKYILRERLEYDENLNELKKTLEELKEKNPLDPNIEGLQKKINWKEKNIEKTIIDEANVICCTTRVLPNYIFKDITFDFVIIDEATQCIEPDVVFCLLKNVKHLILVGDIHQLGPVIKSQMAKDLGFGISTIERLQNLGAPLAFLDTQYRMYPFLSGFSNANIYENKIKNGKTGKGPLIFPNIVKTCGFFYHIQSTERRYMSSYCNFDEALVVINVARYLHSKNIKYKDIGVITFYTGQRRYLRDLVKKYFLTELEVMSVDESQGREKEYIILSCVRSNENCRVGFLNEYKRLNVSMTRAKSGLIVCGNANNFSRSQLWSKLVRYFYDFNAIFTGDIGSMKKFKPKLS